MRLSGIGIRLRGPAFVLGQAPAGTREIEILDTWQLLLGDIIKITFPFGSRGWITYGGTELFRVISINSDTGAVLVRDESANQTTFAGGDKEELLRRLAEKTTYNEVRIYRSQQIVPIQPELLRPAIESLPDEARAEAEDMYAQCVDPDLEPEEAQG